MNSSTKQARIATTMAKEKPATTAVRSLVRSNDGKRQYWQTLGSSALTGNSCPLHIKKLRYSRVWSSQKQSIMSDEEDDLFADSDSDDTADLLQASKASGTTAPGKKQEAKAKKPEDSGLFDSSDDDSDAEQEDAKPAAVVKKKPISKRERLEALAQKKHKDSQPTVDREKYSDKNASDNAKKGYESEDSYDSADFQRTKEDDDFLDTTGEDAEAVNELYAEQHFDDERPDKDKPKKRRRRADEAEEDDGKLEPDNPIMAAVHRMKKKKREKKSFTDMEDACKSFLGKMELAAEEDEQSIRARIPATRKLAMLNEVVEVLNKRDMQRMLLDLDLLVVCKRWVQPLPGGNLGNVTIRQRLLTAIANMTGETGINTNDLKRSEFGKVVMVLAKHRDETPAMKRQLRGLMDQWSRQIFQKSGNMRDLERVSHSRGEGGLASIARQHREIRGDQEKHLVNRQAATQDVDSLIASGKKGNSESGINRVRVPFSKGFDYSVRPAAKTMIAAAVDKRMVKGGPVAKDNRGKLSKRMLEKARPKGKNERSANISIEGRKTTG
jgi:transcription factor SPN1